MAECFLSVPHRFDHNSSIYLNLFGNQGVCAKGFFAGFSLSTYVLFVGTMGTALFWRRWPRVTIVLALLSFGYWILFNLSRLQVMLKYNPDEQKIWIEASISQAVFEFLFVAIVPLLLVILGVGIARRTNRKKTAFGGHA